MSPKSTTIDLTLLINFIIIAKLAGFLEWLSWWVIFVPAIIAYGLAGLGALIMWWTIRSYGK